MFTAHCAALDPARLVRGLGRVVESRGVRIFERTRATEIEPGRVAAGSGELQAEIIVRATEAYTRTLIAAAFRREVLEPAVPTNARVQTS